MVLSLQEVEHILIINVKEELVLHCVKTQF